MKITSKQLKISKLLFSKCKMVILNVSFVVIWYGIQSVLICYISIILFNLKYLRIKSIRLICWNGSFFLNWQMASNFCSPTVCKWIQQCYDTLESTPENVQDFSSEKDLFWTFEGKKTNSAKYDMFLSCLYIVEY